MPPAGPPPRRQQIFLILMMTALLIGILVMRNECGKGAAGLWKTIDPPTQTPTTR